MKPYVFATIIFAVAAVIGGYGQSLAYLIHDWIPIMDSLIILTTLTILELVLFVASAGVVYFQSVKQSNKYGVSFVIFLGIVVVGGVISVGSLLILAFWWG